MRNWKTRDIVKHRNDSINASLKQHNLVADQYISELTRRAHLEDNYAHVFVEEAPVRASNLAGGTLEGTLDARLDIFAASYVYTW